MKVAHTYNFAITVVYKDGTSRTSEPAQPYLEWITNKNTNSLYIDDKYDNKLDAGEEYYFSITAVYKNDVYKTSNSVYLRYLDTE